MDVQNVDANRRVISADVSDQASMDTMRIFIGGLGEGVTDDDLRRMFVALGSVDEIEIIRSKGRSIAYLNFTPSSAKSLAKLFSSFNGCVWKGGKLRIEKAKEHYLIKMEREREKEMEDEIARNDAMMKRTVEVVTLKKPTKGPGAEKEQIRIFFPKLRKVKPLPFSGCGKHKYSFRNIPVPPLPVHFCECELHYVPHDAPIETGGVDEKEFDLMRSVLNKLISKDEGSLPNGNRGPSIVSDDVLESDENEPDEDGIIINISGAMKEPDFLWRSEDKKVSEYQGSNQTNHQTFKMDNKRLPDSNKKRKLGEGSNETGDHSLKNKKDDLNAVSALPIASNSLRAKNSKWKELVGIGADSTFKLSNVLSRGSVQESVQHEDSEDESSMSEDPIDETDESTQDSEDESSNLEEADDEVNESTGESDKSVSEKSEESGDEAEEESSDELAKQKKAKEESSQSEESDDEVNEASNRESAKHEDSDDEVEHEDTEDKSGKLDESDVVMEQESCDDIPEDTENKSDKQDESDNEVEQESSDDLQEDTEEESDKFVESGDEVADEKDNEEALTKLEQHGEKKQLGGVKLTDTEDRLVKKGATWSQVMPWTQLVSDLDNISFSISQILPSTCENKVALTSSLEVHDGSIPQSSKAVKVETTSVSDVHDKKNLSNSVHDSNSLDAIKNAEEKPTARVDSAPKPAMRADSYISRPFVRCPASLKEWAKLKETLRKSGTRKRKTLEE